MRINGIMNSAGNLTAYKNAASKGISSKNTSFKGAYLINGTNAQINIAIQYLDKAKEGYDKIAYKKLGTEAYDDRLLTYVLVATEEDAKTYSDFNKKMEDLEFESIKNTNNDTPDPYEPTPGDFETEKDFENHRRASEALGILERIVSQCKFTSKIRNVSAKRVLGAMHDGKFDYKEGRIKE